MREEIKPINEGRDFEVVKTTPYIPKRYKNGCLYLNECEDSKIKNGIEFEDLCIDKAGQGCKRAFRLSINNYLYHQL